jgi:hypothetical protein
MAVRIGKFGMSWLQPAGQAADLLVEAGRAKGAGIAALGQGIGQGLQAFGQNRRAEKIRSEDMALREQLRQDSLAERAADNARQDAEFSMRQDAWKVEVLTANRDKAMQEAQTLAVAAQELGDPDIVQRAKAAESEAQRFGTALDTLLSSRMGVQGGGAPGGQRGVPMPEAPVRTVPLSKSMDDVAAARTRPTSGPMDEALTQAALSPDLFNAGGGGEDPSPAAPMASAPSMPQVDMKNPFVLAQTAKAKMERAETMLRNPKLGATARNAYERLRLESAAQLGFAQSELAKQEQTQRVETARAEATAKAEFEGQQYNAALRRVVNPATGRPYLSMAEPDLPPEAAALVYNNAKIAGGAEARLPAQMSVIDRRGEIADDRLTKTQDFKREQVATALKNSLIRIDHAGEIKKDLAAAARAGRIPKEKLAALDTEFDNLASTQRRMLGHAKDLRANNQIGQAEMVEEDALRMNGELNELMKQYAEMRNSLGSGDDITKESPEVRKAQVEKAFDALPEGQRTDEKLMEMLKAAGLTR